jgi:dienelactone hydrolase
MSITLLQYYTDVAARIRANAFDGIRTLKDWEARRGELRRCYLHSLGLDGLPADANPAARDFGAEKGKGWSARKVSFRIVQDCSGSGMIFSPDPLPARKNPGVLYLCGHSNFGIPEYHNHAIMWARRGYVCVIIDAIRQTDNTGDHSGLSSFGRDDWISMGYTAAGGEFLNSWAGLNVLCSLPEVDTERVGATGLSGGGAHCFFLAIADERVKAVASTCGVTSLGFTLKNRHWTSNCDCMFWYNLYQKDTSEYGALIAPRPLLFAHARGDYLFTPEENQDLHANIRRIYDLYKCPEKCSLFQFDGPHSYQPSSVRAINDWFDTHLAGRAMPEGTLGGPELTEKQCSIFNGDFPVPDRLDILPELLTPPRSFPIPDTLDGVVALRRKVLPELEERVFSSVMKSPEKLELHMIHEWKLDPVRPFPRMRRYRGSMGGMELWISHHQGSADARDAIVYVCDRDEDEVQALSHLPLDTTGIDVITLEPRAGGMNGWNETWKVNLSKAGLYVGLSPVLMWIKDIREVVGNFRSLGDLAGRNVYLYGARDAGIAALYATLLDESISGVIIRDIYRSHRAGGHIPGILKILDIEQALGLLAPRVIGLDTHQWEFVFWSARLYQRLGIWERFVHTHSMAHTLRRIFGR